MSKLFFESQPVSINIIDKEHIEEDDPIYRIQDISLEEISTDADYAVINRYTDDISIVSEAMSYLDQQPKGTKNYLMAFESSKKYMSVITKNLNVSCPMPSFEDYHKSLSFEAVHQVTMEGFMDTIKEIWKKIKEFFSSLWKKIVLFVKRLVGAEPDFEYLEQYIEKGINKIKEKKLVCRDPGEKVSTNLPSLLASLDNNKYTVEMFFKNGINKIITFKDLYEESIKHAGNLEAELDQRNEGIKNVSNTLPEIIKRANELKKDLNDIIRKNSEGSAETSNGISGDMDIASRITNLYAEYIKLLRDNIETIISTTQTNILNFKTTLGLHEVEPNRLPYTDFLETVNQVEENSIPNISKVQCCVKYETENGSFKTNAAANANILLVYNYIIPNSVIDNNSQDNSIKIANVSFETINEFKFQAYTGVYSHKNTSAEKFMNPIDQVEKLDDAYSVFKKLRDSKLGEFKNKLIKMENKLSDSYKTLDKTFKDADETISSMNEVFLKLSSLIDEEYKSKNFNETIENVKLMNSNCRKITALYIKNISFSTNVLTQLAGSLNKDFTVLRHELLKELGYYILRSINTYR